MAEFDYRMEFYQWITGRDHSFTNFYSPYICPFGCWRSSTCLRIKGWHEVYIEDPVFVKSNVSNGDTFMNV